MIIGLCGRASSGKDTAADFLVDDGFVKVALADPLKRMCSDAFAFTEEQLWGPSAERNKPDARYPRIHGPWVEGKCACCNVSETALAQRACCLTPRFALQQLGTEWGRVCYPNVWVDYTLRVAKQLLESNMERDDWTPGPKGYHSLYYSGPRGLWQGHHERQVKGVAISDVRFPNEIQAINAAGGYVFKLLRGTGLEGAAGQHKSETEMQSIPDELFKGIIDNRNWSLGQLQMHMRNLQQDLQKGH